MTPERPALLLAAMQPMASSRIIEDPRDVVSGRLRALFDYWDRLPRCPDWPKKADLDPTEIAGSLSHVILAKWDADKNDFVHLICGEMVDLVYGVRSTKKYLREIWPAEGARTLVEAYLQPVRGQSPFQQQLATRDGNGVALRYERILLPMTSDGNGIDVLFGGLDRMIEAGNQTNISID